MSIYEVHLGSCAGLGYRELAASSRICARAGFTHVELCRSPSTRSRLVGYQSRLYAPTSRFGTG